MRRMLLLRAALLPLLFVCAVYGQESRGTILGRVTDSSGAVVPTAEVKAVNVATGVAVSAKTNESGNYSLPFLVAGFYNMSAETAGFKKFVRENVQVRVNDRVEVNMQMELGDVSEKVEVTGAPPLLATADASLGQVVDERRVLELPLFSGNAMEFELMAPGAVNTTECACVRRPSTTPPRNSLPTGAARTTTSLRSTVCPIPSPIAPRCAWRSLPRKPPLANSRCRPPCMTPVSAIPRVRWSTSAPRAEPTISMVPSGGGSATRSSIPPPFSRTAPVKACRSTPITATACPPAAP